MSISSRSLRHAGLLLCMVAGSAAACDQLLGTYATVADGQAVVRIFKRGNEFSYAFKAPQSGKNSGWMESGERLMPALSEAVSHTGIPMGPQGCGLVAEDGRFFVKTAVGAEYSVSDPTGRGFETRISKSGYLIWEARGFAVGSIELYKKANQEPMHVEESPPINIATLTCPGNRTAPDMQPSAVAALPKSLREWVATQDTEYQQAFMCGQLLDSFLTHTGTSQSSAESQKEDLDRIQLLLDSGQIPRDKEGRSNWFVAASYLLAHNRPAWDDDPPIPFQQEFYDLFETSILPRMQQREDDVGFGMSLQSFLAEVIVLPDALALKTLRQLKAWQLLPPETSNPLVENPVQAVLIGALSPKVSMEVFSLLAEAAGPYSSGGRDLLIHAIDNRNIEGLKRLLASGADPLANGLMARAERSQYPEIYALLQQEARKGGAEVPDYVDTNIRNAQIKSVYQCRTEVALRQKTQGSGNKGCHFVLRSPDTGAVLANTPYLLDVSQRSSAQTKPRKFSIAGITDEEGRSVHVRGGNNTIISAERFVQIVGDGKYGGGMTATYGAGQIAPRVLYNLFDCSDAKVYEGYTDVRGHTIVYKSPVQCSIRLTLLREGP